MKKKIQKIMAAILTFVLVAAGMLGNTGLAKAEDGPAIALGDEYEDIIVKPGEITRVRIPVLTDGGYISNPVAVASDGKENSPFTFSKVKFELSNSINANFIYDYSPVYAVFDITVKETALIGTYPITLTVKGKNLDDTSCEASLQFKLKILEEKAPTQLTINNTECKYAYPGKDTNLTFTVKNDGDISARSVYMTVDFGETGISKNYSVSKVKVGDLDPGKEQQITLPISIGSSVTLGRKTLSAEFTYKDIDGTAQKENNNIYMDIVENTDGPDVDITKVDYGTGLKPGDKFTLKADFINNGLTTAKDVSISLVSGTSNSFVKNYMDEKVWVADIKPEKNKTADIPLIVSPGASGGINELSLKIEYTDEMGISYTKTRVVNIEVAGGNAGQGDIIISNVKQSPAQPVAGGNLDVSFDFVNKSQSDITELRLSLGNLNGTTFIPVNSEPYIYIEKLAAGAKKRINIPLKISDSIPAGLNNLTVKYTYAGAVEGSVDIPVLDVQNDLGSSSIPKLIISNYTTDIAELKAGSTFNFTFDIYNTHSSVSAKNITVTVTQAENIFSVTQGSNSFFIESIKPGESLQKTLELKVKSDAKTGAYKLHIDIEYEYDGIKPKENGDIGVTRPFDLSLQAVENARPVADNVNVYSYDGNITMGNPAMLSFEFYNMGKSALNNVVATVEGDFTKSDGNMYFVGNVTEGTSTYAEFEVIPNIEGQAKGTLKISYEDSNGDPVEFTKEFETTVAGAQVFNPGMGADPGVGVFNPTAPAKKAILPLWLFIIIQLIVFAAFIPITRKIIITVYRNKLRKKEEENF